jgi:hypothetical protein
MISPRLRARLALARRLTTLLATSYFLIATSEVPPGEPPEPPITSSGAQCAHAELRFSYVVTGSCGSAGTITVMSPVNECAITVQGAAPLGLPSAGRFDSGYSVDLAKGRWSLAGYLPEGAATALPSADAGPFTVTNVAGAAPTGEPVPHGKLVVRRCQATQGSTGELFLQCKDAPLSCAGSSTCPDAVESCTASLQVP